ncbi:39S ribosomal protein L44, mitochondrial [Dispira simplex]|nr:39S ribosomal protein L44, mitochondrial [Dispira simplex]
MTNANLASNPKCKIDVITPETLDAMPNVQIAFRDGKNLTFNTSRMQVEEIVETLTKHTRKLQEDEDNAS